MWPFKKEKKAQGWRSDWGKAYDEAVASGSSREEARIAANRAHPPKMQSQYYGMIAEAELMKQAREIRKRQEAGKISEKDADRLIKALR